MPPAIGVALCWLLPKQVQVQVGPGSGPRGEAVLLPHPSHKLCKRALWPCARYQHLDVSHPASARHQPGGAISQGSGVLLRPLLPNWPFAKGHHTLSQLRMSLRACVARRPCNWDTRACAWGRGCCSGADQVERMRVGTQRLSSPCAAPPLHRGHVVIWDDGSLQGLAPALAHVTRITGSLILLGGVAFGSDLDQPGLTNFEGLGSLQVGGWGPLAAQQVQGAAAAVPWVMRRKHRAKAMPGNTVAWLSSLTTPMRAPAVLPDSPGAAATAPAGSIVVHCELHLRLNWFFIP